MNAAIKALYAQVQARRATRIATQAQKLALSLPAGSYERDYAIQVAVRASLKASNQPGTHIGRMAKGF
jgi:hypothetical protein